MLIFIILYLSRMPVLCFMIKSTIKKGGNYSLLLMILYVWAGMLIGISFLEAPLKFQAPNITLPLGLGIGRLVFSALNKIEILFAVCGIMVCFFIKVSSRFWVLYTIILALLLLQTVWLLPVLDDRAEIIINGGIPPEGSPHIFYVAGELVKLILLITLGIRTHSEYLKSIGGTDGRND